MKFALICPNEPVLDGCRIAQIIDETFSVAEPTYWLECPDDVIADLWYFKNGSIVKRTDIVLPAIGLQSM
jgi:hypothetical protein